MVKPVAKHSVSKRGSGLPALPALDNIAPKPPLTGPVPSSARPLISSILSKDQFSRYATIAETRSAADWDEIATKFASNAAKMADSAPACGALALNKVELTFDDQNRTVFRATEDISVGDVLAVEASLCSAVITSVDSMLELWPEDAAELPTRTLANAKLPAELAPASHALAGRIARRGLQMYEDSVKDTIAQTEIAKACQSGQTPDREEIDAKVAAALEAARSAPAAKSIAAWAGAWAGLSRAVGENRSAIFVKTGPAAFAHDCSPNAAVKVMPLNCSTEHAKTDLYMTNPDDEGDSTRTPAAYSVVVARASLKAGETLRFSRLSDANLLLPVSIRGRELAYYTSTQPSRTAPWGCSCTRCMTESKNGKATGVVKCTHPMCGGATLARSLLPEPHKCYRCGTEVANASETGSLASRYSAVVGLYESWEPFAAMSLGTVVDVPRLATDARIEQFAGDCPIMYANLLELRGIAQGNRHAWASAAKDLKMAIEIMLAAYPSAPLYIYCADYLVPLATALDNCEEVVARQASRVLRAIVGECYLGGGILEARPTVTKWLSEGGGLVGVAPKKQAAGGTFSEQAEACDTGLVKSESIAQVGLLLYPPTACSERFHDQFLRALGRRLQPNALLRKWADDETSN